MAAALGRLNDLSRWTPVFIRTGADASIEWAIVERPLTESFFEQSVEAARRHPFNVAFARRTRIEALDELAAAGVAAEPAGFVFHMSRCGSTLVARMLSALPATVVLSEAQPVDALLRMSPGGVAEATTLRRLRALFGAFVASRGGHASRVIVKAHAWHASLIPLLARLFPQTPWAFVFREPRDVLASHAATAGFELGEHALAADDDAGARLIAGWCETALASGACGRGIYVDYNSLPDAAISRVAPHFGIVPDAASTEAMHALARLDTKGPPGDTFVRPEPRAYPPEIERLAARRLDESYASLRRAGSAQ